MVETKVTVKPLYKWLDVKNVTLTTVGKESAKEPTELWKLKLFRSEHSPIRTVQFLIEMKDIPYWVSVHFVRHKIGVEHFVETQRTDRTGINREQKTQDAPVKHTMHINAASLIYMARKRLCRKAAKETRNVMQEIKNKMYAIEPTLAVNMVPECVYRGICPEFESCGYIYTEEYKVARKLYEDIIKAYEAKEE